MAKGFKIGHRRLGMKYMHSAKGTSLFKRLGAGMQARFAAHDRNRSRKMMGL